jgi:beta-glucosidase
LQLVNENNENDKIFPKSFFWGGSTAEHQVSGGNNQWSVWEQAHARELAQTAHQRLGNIPSWNKVKERAENPDNYLSGRGVEHATRYKTDFDIIKKLNMNSFRFSIEWSRIEPKEGKWDEAALEDYRQYIRELRSRRIEPFANLWHWTMPTWFTEKGGFARRRNVKYFVRFVQKVAEDLSEDLSYVITLNEPNVYTTFGYTIGEWPPQEKNIVHAAKVYFNLVRAHKKAYKILKKQKPMLQVGLAMQLANIQAKRPHNLFDSLSTKIMRYYWNWWFLNRCKKHQDFIGVNYYFSDYYTGLFWRRNPKVPVSDQGWFMEPEGLYPLLLRTWAHYKKPLYVTENGVADETDEYRRWWIEETLVAMEKAISEGVDLRGYFHWSLLDNFEWKYGWWPKFGLVAVDRKHGMKRSIRPSARWFAERIKNITNS